MHAGDTRTYKFTWHIESVDISIYRDYTGYSTGTNFFCELHVKWALECRQSTQNLLLKKNQKKNIQPLKTRGLCATNNMCKQDKMKVSVCIHVPSIPRGSSVWSCLTIWATARHAGGMNLAENDHNAQASNSSMKDSWRKLPLQKRKGQASRGPLRKRNRSRTGDKVQVSSITMSHKKFINVCCMHLPRTRLQDRWYQLLVTHN